MKLMLNRLPPSLHPQRDKLERCLRAMHAALPFRQVYLFGSHARGEARPDSDVDLCLVTEGAASQARAVREYHRAMRPAHPGISFTLVPITPARLAERRAGGDPFYETVLDEGVPLVSEDERN
jgi:predicted nucleotidyltransferase